MDTKRSQSYIRNVERHTKKGLIKYNHINYDIEQYLTF